jgi:hypothetical protein
MSLGKLSLSLSLKTYSFFVFLGFKLVVKRMVYVARCWTDRVAVGIEVHRAVWTRWEATNVLFSESAAGCSRRSCGGW